MINKHAVRGVLLAGFLAWGGGIGAFADDEKPPVLNVVSQALAHRAELESLDYWIGSKIHDRIEFLTDTHILMASTALYFTDPKALEFTVDIGEDDAYRAGAVTYQCDVDDHPNGAIIGRMVLTEAEKATKCGWHVWYYSADTYANAQSLYGAGRLDYAALDRFIASKGIDRTKAFSKYSVDWTGFVDTKAVFDAAGLTLKSWDSRTCPGINNLLFQIEGRAQGDIDIDGYGQDTPLGKFGNEGYGVTLTIFSRGGGEMSEITYRGPGTAYNTYRLIEQAVAACPQQ